jgi:drug/metabolite transporter (DMT)-like permease
MSRHTKAYIALVFICIVWGTTYLAIRVGALNYPAFLFAAIRQLISGFIILVIGYMLNNKVDLSKKNVFHQAIVGFMLITVGNGLVTWGEKNVPSGIAALICSLMPLVAVLINMIGSTKEKLNSYIIIGMLIGFGGVGLIFKDDVSGITNTDYLWGIFATLVATTSWAAGSVFNKKRISLVNPIFNSGLQLFFGGCFLFLCSPLMDSYEKMDLFKPVVIWSLVYLIVFGSVLAYSAYMFALKELPVGIVSMYAYVNPLVAVILGYLILKEPVTIYTGIAFISIVSGVYLVNYGYKLQHRKTAKTGIPNLKTVNAK